MPGSTGVPGNLSTSVLGNFSTSVPGNVSTSVPGNFYFGFFEARRVELEGVAPLMIGLQTLPGLAPPLFKIHLFVKPPLYIVITSGTNHAFSK